jgi:hypothetical protein
MSTILRFRSHVQIGPFKVAIYKKCNIVSINTFHPSAFSIILVGENRKAIKDGSLYKNSYWN